MFQPVRNVRSSQEVDQLKAELMAVFNQVTETQYQDGDSTLTVLIKWAISRGEMS